MSVATRKALSLLPSRTKSETTISHPNDTSPLHPEDSDDESDNDDEEWTTMTLSPADILVIKRLSKRANVLPVIARADSLTNDKLTSIKKVIRRDLDAAGLDFGVFGPIKDPHQTEKSPSKVKVNGHNGRGRDHGDREPSSEDVDGDGDDGSDTQEERSSRPIIKLRATRNTKRRMSHSRSRRELSEAANEPVATEVTDNDSVASIRFSAQIVGKADLADSLPFALIAPEPPRRKARARPVSTMSEAHSTLTDTAESSTMPAPSEDGHAVSVAESSLTSPTSPTDASSSRNFSYLAAPPADLKGVFVRRFRWGTVDVLAPEHCDFAALRTAVLSTHMKVRVFC